LVVSNRKLTKPIAAATTCAFLIIAMLAIAFVILFSNQASAEPASPPSSEQFVDAQGESVLADTTTDQGEAGAESITANMTLEIIDSDGKPVNADISIVNDSGNSNLIVDFQDTEIPIQSIEFENIDTTTNVTETLGIDDAPETEGPAGQTIVETYAIDPTALNFTEAIVTVTASPGATALYKCASWDFQQQSCTDGNWIFVQNIIPEENYTIALTANDPAYSETQQPDNTAGKDSFIISSAQARNHGISTGLEVKSTTGNEEALFEFNLSSISSSAAITSATLTLYAESAGTPSEVAEIGAYRLTASWVEGTGDGTQTYDGVTWSNRSSTATWTTAGGDYNAIAFALTNVTVVGSYSWNVTNLVRGWVNGTWTNNGLILVNTAAGINKKTFTSSDGATAANRPKLIINYTTALNISFVSPTPDNGSTTPAGQNWVYVNASLTNGPATEAKLEWAGTNYTMGGSGSNWYYNKTSLASGTYTYKVYANDSATKVFDVSETRTVTVNADTTPPATVTNLQNQSAGGSWVYWSWANPADIDFSQAIIYVNGSNVANTSNNYYNATGLTSENWYVITIHTKDTNGNINNTDVNSTARTADVTAPAAVTGLADQSSSRTWIYWDWTNPVNPDFSEAIVYINGSNVANTSNNYYNATSLACNSAYVITVHTKDTSNNINNTDVSDNAITPICNIAPVSTTPTITPATAYTNGDLNCSFTITDEDAGDTLTANYTWYNGTTALIIGAISVINGTESSIILDAGNTTKEETWNCSVIPYDGHDYGTAKPATKVITNSLPTAPIVDVIPDVPTDNEDLVATIATPSIDLDNDTIGYAYQWYKNGLLQIGQTANTLSKLLTTIGDDWKCIVTPNDGTGNGATGQDNVTISALPDTTAPIITISNPTNGSQLSAGTMSVIINITTNEDAICRYNLTNSTFAYADGTDFTNTNSSVHNFTLNGLANNTAYTLYYKCNDTAGNVNNIGTVHSFSVAASSGGSGNNNQKHKGGGGGGGSVAETITNQTPIATINQPVQSSPKSTTENSGIKNTTLPFSGATVQVNPIRGANPLFAVPTLLLLILLFAILALRSENLTEKTKKMLTKLHILLVVTIIVLLVFTFVKIPLIGESISVSILQTQFEISSLVLGLAAFLAGLTITVLLWVWHNRKQHNKLALNKKVAKKLIWKK